MKLLAAGLFMGLLAIAASAGIPAVIQMAMRTGFYSDELTHHNHKGWQMFKKTYNKLYHDADEESKRFKHFLGHVSLIESHNKLYAAGKKSYTLGLNHFADMSHSEWKGHIGSCLLRRDAARKSKGSTFLSPAHLTAPKQVDWRQKGYVTAVKNQGQCGSCWSFSTTGALEGQTFRKTGKLVSLSEQQLIDCSRKYGNMGCNGGLMDNAFQYVEEAGGLESEKDYPYIDRMGPRPQKCKFDESKVVAKDTGFVDIPVGNEHALTMALASQGPVSVAIDAGEPSFMLYKSGVYDEPECSPTKLDHGVLAVGYGVDDETDKDFYIVKNSWSAFWGENGYIRMSRNKDNQCGIASSASYPLV